MASKYTEQFYIKDSTPEGERLLDENYVLQQAMAAYIDAREPHREYITGSRLLGSGKYSFAFALSEEVAIKISSPTTGQRAREHGITTPPEKLTEQFRVLASLHDYLGDDRDDITTPNQLFVSKFPNGTFVLAQEFMKEWVSLNEKTDEVYGTEPETPDVFDEINYFTDNWRARIRSKLGRFELRRQLNDLGGKVGRLHGGNILVPRAAELNGDTPLCIIDQPGILDE